MMLTLFTVTGFLENVTFDLASGLIYKDLRHLTVM